MQTKADVTCCGESSTRSATASVSLISTGESISVRCALCAVRCALCAVRCALCAVRCALCAVRCAEVYRTKSDDSADGSIRSMWVQTLQANWFAHAQHTACAKEAGTYYCPDSDGNRHKAESGKSSHMRTNSQRKVIRTIE
jgi:hypothetical protein